MTRYKYGTVLEAKNDGKPPNDSIEKGDKIIEPGKVESDKITYLDENNDIAVIQLEAAAIYEADKRMSEREATSFARDKWGQEHG